MSRIQENAIDYLWNKIPEKYKTLVSLIILALIVFITLFATNKLTFNSGNVVNNSGVVQTATGNSAPVSQTATVNQIATYTWANKDSWIADPYGGTYGEGNYRTDLKFEATTLLYPSAVCEKILFSSNAPITGVSALPSGSSVFYRKSDGSICFQSPKSNVVLQLITHGKPITIQAQLINE